MSAEAEVQKAESEQEAVVAETETAETEQESPALSYDEYRFRREIEEFYLPRQLVDAILELGEIPRDSVETLVGIGFLDIADYTFVSKFLSPNENQAVLNGLFTALHWVLKRHGGYLNKIEGDSMMFHYGGPTDPNIKGMNDDEKRKYIARELFYSCVEMQRVCTLFNQANDKFIYEEVDAETRAVIRKAFDIIGFMRNSLDLGEAFNAVFQIRLRIGASIGEVTVGNIGPKGAKQWDIIGLPVITAKRMESTAPIGGLRISEEMYNILEDTGVARAYFQRFQREARALFGVYGDITRDELYKPGMVQLKDKKNVEFNTFSIQVSPGLPEALSNQVELLIDKGSEGADRIIDFLMYYRGNKLLINALEELLQKKRVDLRKEDLFHVMLPSRHGKLKKTLKDPRKRKRYFDRKYSIYELMGILGKLQDSIKYSIPYDPPPSDFLGYESCFAQELDSLKRRYKLMDKNVHSNAYFYNVVFPAFFGSIETSILEFQHNLAKTKKTALQQAG